MPWREPVSVSEAAEHLLRLVSVYSPTGEEDEAVRVFLDLASSLGLAASVDGIGNGWACVNTQPPAGNVDALLVGHIDTVEGWIEPRVDGTTVWGRGAVDAKSPLLAMLYATAGYSGSGRVCVVAAVGEEGDSRGAWYVVRSGVKARHLIVGEPTRLSVVVGYRGSMPFRVECRAEGGHSASPDPGRSAFERFISAWLKLRGAYGYARADRPSMAVTMVRAGSSPNVLPSHLEALIDCRVPAGWDVEALRREVIDTFTAVDCRVEFLGFTPPVKVKPQEPTPRALIRALLRLGLKPRISVKHGTSDMNILIGTVAREGATFGPGDPMLSHTDREHVDAREVLLAAKVEGLALEQLLG